jgi:hypothetical protein
MRHGEHSSNSNGKYSHRNDFVLEKGIFSNIFEKDIRRVFIYKKAERIGKALALVAPAFVGNAPLCNRVDTLALGLIDAATLHPHELGTALPRELLALSSVLALGEASGVLSPMNAEIILQECHTLLKEIEGYEDPTLTIEDVPSIAILAKNTHKEARSRVSSIHPLALSKGRGREIKDISNKGHLKDTKGQSGMSGARRDSILSVIRNKGNASIKDISNVIRGVSEKTLQRELLGLIASGIVVKNGERRWSSYTLA